MSPWSRSAAHANGRMPGSGLVVLATLSVIALVAVGGALVLAHRSAPPVPTTTTTPTEHQQELVYQTEQRMLAAATADVGVRLPSRPGEAVPVSGSVQFAKPLASHQVFGFVPYWELGAPGTVDELSSLTTVAYFALGISSNGAPQDNGLGWDDLQTQGFADLLQGAHAEGTRVLLTVSTTDDTVLDAISAHPTSAAAAFVSGLDPTLESYHFDGVDIDLEGTNGSDRVGFAHFVDTVADKLHAVDSSWTVAIDTYPQSAGDPGDFYDVAAIAPHVDQVFVMAYDMEDEQVPSANSPLTGAAISDVAALQSYVGVVPPSKLILGLPFYGVDWTHLRKGTAPGSVSAPIALDYSTVAGAGHTPLWDPVTDTVWFSYSYQGKEHEVWFDDPLSLALKAALASQYKIAGVGIWALGMQGNSPALVAALTGGSPVLKLSLAREPSAS